MKKITVKVLIFLMAAEALLAVKERTKTTPPPAGPESRPSRAGRGTHQNRRKTR